MASPVSLTFNTKRDNSSLVVVYNDGDVCLFDYEKLKLILSVKWHARTAACSPDGKTLATWGWNGTVRLLEFDTLQLMCQVSANGKLIQAGSFSADNMRFLDVRGTQCNVWEPAVLRGMARRDGSSTEPARCEPVIQRPEVGNVRVTSIAVDDSSSGRYFFVHRSDGSISLVNTASGEQQNVLFRDIHQTGLPVTAMVWGSEKSIIALGGRFGTRVVVLQRDDESGWKVSATHSPYTYEAAGKVVQLLLDPSNNLLLVSTREFNTVWNLTGKQLVSKRAWRPPDSFRWINHPGSPAHRILITDSKATIFDWESESLGTRSVAESTTKTPSSISDCGGLGRHLLWRRASSWS